MMPQILLQATRVCLGYAWNTNTTLHILVSYPLQVLNYPTNKIHLVFDSWQIFLSVVEKKCVDSLTPLISTGVTRNHLDRLCCRVRAGGWTTQQVAWEVQHEFTRLWVGAHVAGVPDRPGKASRHHSAHSRGSRHVEYSDLGGDGLDCSVFFLMTGNLLGCLTYDPLMSMWPITGHLRSLSSLLWAHQLILRKLLMGLPHIQAASIRQSHRRGDSLCQFFFKPLPFLCSWVLFPRLPPVLSQNTML